MNKFIEAQSHMVTRITQQILEERAFYLMYQPIINADKQILRLEALLRLNEKYSKKISLSHFIYTLEKNNKIFILTKFVIQNSFYKLNLWQKELNKKIHLSFNISSQDIAEPELFRTLYENCYQYHIDPFQITLEITETQCLKRNERFLSNFQRLLQAGFNLSLDDFGSGYSNSKVLDFFNFTNVKIDKSLIPKNAQQISKIHKLKKQVKLFKKNNINVTAEGIENNFCWDLCKKLDINLFQGFFISHPKTFKEITQILQSQ
ncbi:EAL domain-containing protein [Paraphotobacterium marinum]